MNKQENIPALRFPEFTGNWVARKLRELTDLITKGTTPKKFVSEGIKFIKIECFEEDRINANKCLFVEEYTHNKELKRSILQEGDLLFAIAGATIGKVNFVTKDILPANTNQALAIIRLKQSENRDYIYQVLRSKRMQKYILDSISVGAQPNLNLEQMGNFSFYYPTLPEQQKIATFLSSVDEKLQGLKKKKSLLEAYKKGMMQRLFSQTLRFKDENGEDFPEWEEKTLGDYIDVISGIALKGEDITENKSGTPILRGINITEGYIRHSSEIDRFFLTNDMSSYKKFLLKETDIVLGMDGSKVGKNVSLIGLADAGSILIQRVARIRATDKSDIHFIYQSIYSKSFQDYVDVVNTSSGIPHISLQQIKDYELSFPSLSEQTKIANFLSAIDEKIAKVSEEIEQATVWKKGLLQQMFV